MARTCKDMLEEECKVYGQGVGACVRQGCLAVDKDSYKLLHDQALDEILVANSDEEIERQWQRIETSLTILRNMHIERANMEFWTRVKMMMEGMR